MAAASYTVEAALLMMVILPVVTALLIFSFYLHDSALFQGVACETAAMGASLQFYEDGPFAQSGMGGQVVKGRILWSHHVSASGSVSSKASSGECGGYFSVPGWISRFWTGGSLPVLRSWERELYQPAQLIRHVQGLEEVLEYEDG